MADGECSSGPGGAPGGANDPDGSGDPNPGTVDDLQFQFIVSVPFRFPEEAQIAHCFLLTNSNKLGPARREIQVDGSILTVHLTSEDPKHLWPSMLACVDLLSMVLRALQKFMSLVMTTLHRE